MHIYNKFTRMTQQILTTNSIAVTLRSRQEWMYQWYTNNHISIQPLHACKSLQDCMHSKFSHWLFGVCKWIKWINQLSLLLFHIVLFVGWSSNFNNINNEQHYAWAGNHHPPQCCIHYNTNILWQVPNQQQRCYFICVWLKKE